MFVDFFERWSLILSNKHATPGGSFLFYQYPCNSFLATVFDKLVHTSTNLSIPVLFIFIVL